MGCQDFLEHRHARLSNRFGKDTQRIRNHRRIEDDNDPLGTRFAKDIGNRPPGERRAGR
jgi:hypothetical protein